MNNDELSHYVAQQLFNLLPDTNKIAAASLIKAHLANTLEPLHHIISKVKMWTPGQFDHLHSSQYCIFLYLLSNEMCQKTNQRDLPTRLFNLNKAMSGIDLFYEIEMPPVFFIGHSVGIVLAKADYGNYLVLYQNSTVGKNHGIAPIIGKGVIMYPNSAIIGRAKVGDNTVLSQGTSLINQDSEGHGTIYLGENSRPFLKPFKSDALPLEEYFRL